MRKTVFQLLFVFQFAFVGVARSETALVATASNFRSVAEKLEAAFERQTPHDLTFTFGATGMLLAQTANGAPFDVFLGADQTSAARLVNSGDAVADSRFTYAVGRLVLVSVNRSAFGVDPATVLRDAQFRRLAIANPAIAPYGAAATDVVKYYGLEDKLKEKYVVAQNVGQAYAFVASGNADFGFVAYSFIANSDGRFEGAWWEPPQQSFRPIRQDAVLLTRARDNKAAQAFLNFLQSPTGLAIIEAGGYRAPE